MKNHLIRQRKVFHLFQLLSERDRSRFKDFLSSPYHNKSRVLVKFWEMWQARVLDDENGESLTVAEFLEGSELKPSRFDKMCSTIHKRAKEFLALQALEEQSQLKTSLAASAILKRDPQMVHEDKLWQPLQREIAQVKTSPEKFHHAFLNLSDYTQSAKGALDFFFVEE